MLKNEEENTIQRRCRECETDTEGNNTCGGCDDALDGLITDATDRIQLCKMLKQKAIRRWTQEIKQTDK